MVWKIGEVKLRVMSVEDRIDVIDNHVEYALTELNELHNTHVPDLENKCVFLQTSLFCLSKVLIYA
jgi:hypothetical protein